MESVGGSVHRSVAGLTMMLAMATVSAAVPVWPEAFFEQHCYACHSGAQPEAGLDLTIIPRNLADPAVIARLGRVHDRIARGEMPPTESERPLPTDVAAVTQWLDTQLYEADAQRIAAVGRTRLRRMTVREYENTVRDLLGLEYLDIHDLLPPDGSVAGFDKIADGLDLSPVHIAAYANAAEKALDAAISIRSTPPPSFKRRIYPAQVMSFFGYMLDNTAVLLKDRQRDPRQPLPTSIESMPEGLSVDERHILGHKRRDARKQAYKAAGIESSESAVGLLGHPSLGVSGAIRTLVEPLYSGRYRIRMSVWGFQWNKASVEMPEATQAAMLWAYENKKDGGRSLGIFTAPSLAPREYEITPWLVANENLVIDPVSLRYWNSNPLVLEYVGPGVALDWYEIEGPLADAWPPESHRRLFGDLPIQPWPADAKAIPPQRPAKPAQSLYGIPVIGRDLPKEVLEAPLETVHSSAPREDARRLLSGFLPRAFRRPITAEEVEPYVALVAARLENDDCFEDAMRRAYVAALTSPHFLFHPADDRLDQHGLAARLAYWLWNSPPDDALLAAAEAGTLADPAVIRAQVDRLLDDPRSNRFITDFLDQWLDLRRIDETFPDRQLYPEYRVPLHEGMLAETHSFLRELIAKDLPIRNLVDADFTMLTQRLAEHYGISGVDGVEVRRVALPLGSRRGGLLTQAAVLKVTANGTTTSPVKRGVWVMDRLLDDPPPPPPPGIPGIEPDTRGATTIRQQLALHSRNASCAVCHRVIDPPGLAMEAFDPIGGYRDRYRSTNKGDLVPHELFDKWRARYRLGLPVDASGVLSDGRRFSGINELKVFLAENPAALARAFVAHMSRYATGVNPTYADRRTIDNVVAAAAATDYGVRSLIHEIAVSRLLPQPR